LNVPRGAMPVIVDTARCVTHQFPISVMITGGMLILGGASPATVQPLLDVIGARRWIPAVAPPARLVCEPGDSRFARVCLPAADRGHDLQWLVDSGGDIGADEDEVASAVGRQIHGMVAGAPVVALHPDTDVYADMVTVRVPPDRAAAMRALASTGLCIHVAGRECRLFPPHHHASGAWTCPSQRTAD